MKNLPVNLRICENCKTVEDEKHFLVQCEIIKYHRLKLFRNINDICPNFVELSDEDKLV